MNVEFNILLLTSQLSLLRSSDSASSIYDEGEPKASLFDSLNIG